MKNYNSELFEEVVSSSDPVAFFNNNKHKFQNHGLKEHLNYLLKEKCVSKSHIITESTINITYAYHIFAGDKRPSREKVLALAFAFRLNLMETQQLLKHAEVMELSVFSLRDAAIVYAIVNEYHLMKINNLLHDLGEKTLE